jgi:hypothetical protein
MTGVRCGMPDALQSQPAASELYGDVLQFSVTGPDREFLRFSYTLEIIQKCQIRSIALTTE